MPKLSLSRPLKVFCIALLALAGVAAAWRAISFTGPAAPPRPLPAARIVDMHVHLAGYGNGGSGCYVSPRLLDNYRFDFYLRGFDTTREELARFGDEIVVDRIAMKLRASRHVSGAVLLALDGAVDAGGELDRARTEVYIPNHSCPKQPMTLGHPKV